MHWLRRWSAGSARWGAPWQSPMASTPRRAPGPSGWHHWISSTASFYPHPQPCSPSGLRVAGSPCVAPAARAALEVGEIDAQVLPVVPGAGDAPSTGPLRRAQLLRDGWRIVLRAGHPLHDRLDLAGWCAARHLLVSPRGEGPGLVDLVLAEHGVERDVCVRIAAFAAALGIVTHTELALTAPASLARLAGPEVAVHPVPLALPEHAVVRVWSERVDADPGGRWFRALVREAAP